MLTIIDDDGFNKITCAETLKFFRSLGGTERVYKKNGKLIVEDVKGMKTDIYKIKKKLMAYINKIEIIEI